MNGVLSSEILFALHVQHFLFLPISPAPPVKIPMEPLLSNPPPRTRPLSETNPYSTITSNHHEPNHSLSLHLKATSPAPPPPPPRRQLESNSRNNHRLYTHNALLQTPANQRDSPRKPSLSGDSCADTEL
ncbi:hypothetical protein CesoFtcFv8_023788 [Champsocephalus esox]|uniref:Uncharacterized protein n=1 Tax=Champsocephalus esox TaxID=159716 RepID=A0AAN8GFR3_9TELE|nr:hypothetical protein CesoFtcFv8_023788 [Champsocephalus esox]